MASRPEVVTSSHDGYDPLGPVTTKSQRPSTGTGLPDCAKAANGTTRSAAKLRRRVSEICRERMCPPKRSDSREGAAALSVTPHFPCPPHLVHEPAKPLLAAN